MSPPVCYAIDQECIASELQRLRDEVTVGNKIALDFSAVRRMDARALQEMELLARAVHDKSVKVVIQGLKVEVYKVLKLARLTSQFQFED